MTRVVLGVDPGLSGAIAAVDIDHGNVLAWALDTPIADGSIAVPVLMAQVDGLLRSGGGEVVAVAVEKVGSMPGQGVASTFKFGQAYGVALGFFGARYPLIHVTPVAWKRHLTLTGKDKDAARLRAIDRWPSEAAAFARKKDCGRADAALIALWLAETQPIARGAAA
jgi:crossover junction endodeoxyribonuclease RuvC